MANHKIPELRDAILREFGRIDARQVERALAALVDGGAADHIATMNVDAPGHTLELCDEAGRCLAWLRRDHLDIVAEHAPDYALLDGHADGVQRVPFPGYGESISPFPRPAQRAAPSIPCQLCFNFHEPDEDCF